MARRQRLLRVGVFKTIMKLLFCSFLLLKAKQTFRGLSVEMNNLSILKHYYDKVYNLNKFWNQKCSENAYLGRPSYVDKYFLEDGQFSYTNLTCKNLLFSGKQSVSQSAKEFMSEYIVPRLSDDDFIQMTRNCSAFRRLRGFDKKTGEENLQIAFNLIVHEDVEQIERLIYALYRPRNSFCIHLDLKSSRIAQEALEGICRCLPNVFMATRRLAVYWGEFSRLEADIGCMKDQINRNSEWKYLLNTAGQAFPIRSIKEMVQILKIYNGSNDIEGMTGQRVIRNRFEYQFYRDSDSMIVMKEPKVRHSDPPHEFDIVRGSAYGIFSREFVEYIITDNRAKDLLEWSKETFSPDELYWATLHHSYTNPHFSAPGGYADDPNLKPWLAVYVNWLEELCGGNIRHGICVFGVEDLPRIMNRKEFFVNKFLADFEPMALDCLRAWIDYKDSCTGLELLDTDFYKALPFTIK